MTIPNNLSFDQPPSKCFGSRRIATGEIDERRDKIGEQFGDFLRGFLRTPATASAKSPEAIQPPRKWAVVDANEVSTGVMVSLDLELDPSEPPGQMTRDPEADGLVHFPTGVTSPLNLVVAKDYANAISLIPAVFPGAQPSTSVSGWHLVADGDPQPFGKSAYQISFFERLVPGTDVMRIGGHIFDPNTQKRVNFSVTHDPIETVILAVVVGFAALICGGVVLHDAILNAGYEKAQAQWARAV